MIEKAEEVDGIVVVTVLNDDGTPALPPRDDDEHPGYALSGCGGC